MAIDIERFFAPGDVDSAGDIPSDLDSRCVGGERVVGEGEIDSGSVTGRGAKSASSGAGKTAAVLKTEDFVSAALTGRYKI
jgi:hypothetical protein